MWPCAVIAVLATTGGFVAGTTIAGSALRTRGAAHVNALGHPPLWAGTVTAGSSAAVTLANLEPIVTAAMFAWVLIAAWILTEDVTAHRIPNRASLLIAAAGATPVFVSAVREHSLAVVVLPAVASALVLGVGTTVATTSRHVGLGDAKLAVAIVPLVASKGAAAAGASLLLISLLSLLTAVLALARGAHSNARIPLGPALVYGAILGVLQNP